MAKGLVNRIIPFSSVDGPGNRAAIFLQGCNFNCLYCHNPETINLCRNCFICVKECPYGALSVEEGIVLWNNNLCKKCDICLKCCPYHSSPKVVAMETEEVVTIVKRISGFISGVTVSGGECMLQSEFLISLFEKMKDMNLTTFIDTNGSIPFQDNQKLISVMDMAMIDVKSFDSEEHKKLTGMDHSIVLKNVEFLGNIGKLYEIRTVIVPDILDNYSNVDSISRLIAKINPSIRYKLIKYRPLGVRKELMESCIPSDAMMNELAGLSKANGCNNVVIT
ncbi:MAG: radical protein [Anaerocolumna sp.]|nr:radical protein [Anaerocolumna sp.]